MKKVFRIFSIFLALAFIISACGPLGLGSSNVLYVNLTWHQHQPLYYKDADGVYTRPWVRAHATKDYYDMAAMVADYPNVHVTINITPVLMKQLDDYVNNGAKDYYWVLAEKPAATLTDEEKTYILTRFFDANWDNIIGRFPRYKELLSMRGGTTSEAIAAAVGKFSEQDFRDLQIWFNLAWIDPMFLAEEPLKALVDKGEGYSEEDKTVLFDQVRVIMSKVIAIHKELQDAGQIQVTTTPYAHPILPLIYNTDKAAVGNSSAELPERFSWPNDAIVHLNKSVEMYEQHFGRKPVGLWPGEGAVSDDIIPLVAKAGYQYMQTGEAVLAPTLGIGTFTRDSQETVQEADALYRPYFLAAPDDKQVAVFFRDQTLSDKLGFTYSQTPGEVAAADLMQRLENIRLRLKAEKAKGPHIVSIVLDGENAWEYYPNDGKEFLSAMYRMFNDSKTIKMVTPSEYLEMFPKQKTLDSIYPGAWFSPNYDTWIGESEETQAWNYLVKVREFLAKYDVSKKSEAPAEAVALAQDYMYLAEGSDWFWWYGADQDSGVDGYFDVGFRALLAKVYESLGQPVPSFVNVPIIPKAVEQPEKGYSEAETPEIDGTVGANEWSTAATYPVNGSAHVSQLSYTMDKQGLYLKLDLKAPLLETSRLGIYLDMPGGTVSYPFARETDLPDQTLLGIAATNLFEWDGVAMNSYLPVTDGWKAGTATESMTVVEDVLEMMIPLAELGDLSAGDDIRMVVVLEPSKELFPVKGPAQIILPDLGLSTPVLEIVDPQGDDHGPGSYSYPQDSVFSAGNFDILNFSVSTDAKNVIFKFKFAGAVPNPWNSGNNLSLQSLDVYIDKDPGKGTGNRLLLPGRNASLSTGNGWEFAIWAEGWTPGIFAPDPATGDPKQLNTAYKIIVDPAGQTVTLRVPRESLGEGDPAAWGYAAVVMSQDGYPSTGVWRVRDVQESAAQWKIGGGPADTNHTRILDIAWPAEIDPTQAVILGTYPTSTVGIDTLGADDFAQIPLLIVQ